MILLTAEILHDWLILHAIPSSSISNTKLGTIRISRLTDFVR